jgi:hypothetical protein
MFPTGMTTSFLSSIYQILDVNPKGMFWIATNGKYWIVGKNVHNNFKDIVLTLGTTTSMANIAMKSILMKEKPTTISHNIEFSISVAESLFINLCNSSNEDGPSFPNVVVPIFMNS